MLYRIEYRYFYYERDFLNEICHAKLATYTEFEKEPTKKELVDYFNENLVNKDFDIHRNKLYLVKIDGKEEIHIDGLLDLPANVIVEKVSNDGECYVTSGIGFKFTTSKEDIKAGVSEERRKYGKYIRVKEYEDFKKLSKKKQEKVLEDMAELNRQSEEREYSEDNLVQLHATLNSKEADRFLAGF